MANVSPSRKPALPARVVAIDIGTDAVHAVEVHNSPEPRVIKRGSAPLPSPVWQDLPSHKEALAIAIKSALSAGGISANAVQTVIPRRMVTLKYARLPHAEPDQIRSMVRYEAQQYVPFPLEEVVLDHQIVSDELDEMTTVMIVAARLALVETLLATFDRAGLEVTHISVSALALAEHARGTALPVALLEVDGGELDLAVVSADKLLFSRAASLHSGRGRADSPSDQMTAEVARSLAAYQNEHRSAPVSRVLVAGRAEEITEVQAALNGLLDIPVGPLTSQLLLAADPSGSGYAVATGLALQAGGGGISTIDLIPPSRTERKVAARRRVNSAITLVASAAALAVLGIYLTGRLSKQSEEAKEAGRQNRKLSTAKTALAKVNADYDKVMKAHQALVVGTGRSKPMVDVVKAVSDSIPKSGGLYLTQLAFERGSVLSIHGNAADETAATDLVIALQSSGAFKEVRLNYLGDNSSQAAAAPSLPRRPARRAAPASRPTPTGSRSLSGLPSGLPAPGPSFGGGMPDFADLEGDTADPSPLPGTANRSSVTSMSFLITCKVIGAEVKDFIEKAKKTTTLAADRSNP